jgi:NAD+-dependent protein deacetylase SIR2
LLQDKGKLLTNYTQNIDNLEESAGIQEGKLIQCHGSFRSATCTQCGDHVAGERIFDSLRAGEVAYCRRGVACVRGNAKMKKEKKNKSKRDGEGGDTDEEDNIAEPGVMKVRYKLSF